MKKDPKTPLIQTSIFSHLDMLNTYIKDESENAFGTIKDRRNSVIIEEANRLKVDKLVLITSGNNGYSLAKLAEETPIKVVCVVNRSIDRNILSVLKSVSYQVIELNLNEKILRPEEIISFARERDDEVIWDITNGYEDAYFPIVAEIFEKLPKVDYIVVPMGSGGIFIGIVQALERLKKKTKVIGIGTLTVGQSIADKLSTPWTPYSRAIENYMQNGHKVIRLNEQEIKSAYSKYQHLVKTEPSSSIVFAAPQKFQFNKDDIVVFLNSGKMKLIK